MITRDEIMNVFTGTGNTDYDYLNAHLPRFLNTYHRFDSTWDRVRGVRMLDIGAHWLHQAAVFRLGGYEVIAADVPNTLDLEPVKATAKSLGIELITYTNLSAEGSLSAVASDSIDVIMMAEIIEHITFNPVELWKEVYRVLVQGGRIIVTTPNYYRAGGRAWQWKRFRTGYGAGISTNEILSTHTMGHHWKEFSLRELQHYFCLLSPDFECIKAEYTTDKEDEKTVFQDRFKRLRQGIHLEVELPKKSAGITMTPSW